ncbi:hypothetical protein ACN47E_005509 [Coniothyrium glycines]
MTSSESEERAPTRKRPRTGNTNDDGVDGRGKKARGRPRVHPQDATAADRRRTQIRLAQRAYRQRKETTISSLKSQSSQLLTIIEQMNRNFLQLNKNVVKSGLLQLNSTLAQEFKVVTETFGSLMESANETQDIGEDEHAEHGESIGNEERPPDHPPTDMEVHNIVWGYSMIDQNSSSVPEPRDVEMETQPDNYFNQTGSAFGQSSMNNSLVHRRQFTVSDLLDQSRASNIATSQVDQHQPLPFGLVEILNDRQAPFAPTDPHVFAINMPTPEVTPPVTRLSSPPLSLFPPITRALTPVKTYSFNEPTFARRLTRAVLETGLRLLMHADIRPAALSHVFKLSLPYFTPDQLIVRFQKMLARNIYEDLENSDTPFIRLGGAGTHYPRRDAAGNIVLLRNSWTVRQIGPLERRMARIQNLEDGQYQDLEGVDLSGYAGEWFDANDVEGYLEEKFAFKLDPRSSLAACLIEEPEVFSMTQSAFRPPSISHSTSTDSSEVVTPPPTTLDGQLDVVPFGLDISMNTASTMKFPSDFPKANGYDMCYNQTLELDLAPDFNYGFMDTSNMDLGLDVIGESFDSRVVPRQKKKKKSAWVDVSRLVDEIVKHSVCLGRAPGFRKKDVDMAVQKALVAAS